MEWLYEVLITGYGDGANNFVFPSIAIIHSYFSVYSYQDRPCLRRTARK